MNALDMANETRAGRARIRRDLAAGRRSFAQVLDEAPPEILSMPIGQLLAAQPRWGKHKVDKFAVRLGIKPERAVGRLTVRQRDALRDAVANWQDAHRGKPVTST